MLTKFIGSLPRWAKEKVMVRIIYTSSSFVTARIVALLTGDYFNSMAASIVSGSGHIGIKLQFQVISVDQRTLEAFITGTLMIAAEYLINHLHETKVKPAILASETK